MGLIGLARTRFGDEKEIVLIFGKSTKMVPKKMWVEDFKVFSVRWKSQIRTVAYLETVH